jgi:hypothetical protein
VRPEAMTARGEALVDAALLLGLCEEDWAPGSEDAAVGAAGGACGGWLPVDRGAGVDVALGTGVGVLPGAGVGELGAGQTPAGDGGTDEELWPSYLKPSASPSRNVCEEMPRLEVTHDAPAWLTNIAQ